MSVDATVRALLEAAKLELSNEECGQFVDIYPLLRAQADGLNLPQLENEVMAVAFDPLVDYPK